MYLPKIFLSADDKFFDFAIPVILSWRKFFPSIRIHITLVSNTPEMLNKLSHLDIETRCLPIVDSIPVPNQAKLARLFSASCENGLAMIEDIDTAPLQTDFLVRIFSEIDPQKILAVGHEVYKDEKYPGQFPMSNLTGTGNLIRKLINPQNLEWENWFTFLDSLPIEDGKERPSNYPSNYSDESTIRSLTSLVPTFEERIKKIPRGVDAYNQWIDRSWWRIDIEKLYSGKYILVNFLRPCKENFNQMKPIFDFIYGKDTDISDLG